jgi:phosphoribosylformylglycinamidine synthase
MTKISVKVMLKDGLLDPQGEAILKALGNLGFSGINSVRQGKILELELAHTKDLEKQVEDMCEKLLVNTVIESYKTDFGDDEDNEIQ